MARNETITGTQIRAARGFLAWDRRDLVAKGTHIKLICGDGRRWAWRRSAFIISWRL